MATPQLSELIEWVKKNDKHRLEIYDEGRNKPIQKCASYDDITRNGISADDYFVGLINTGVKTVQLVKKRKNGSTYTRESCAYNYVLTVNNDNVAASGRVDSPPATPQQTQNPYPVHPGLGNPAFGLGFPEIMQLRSNSDRFDETKNENRELKSKVERLESENKRLETECLTQKLGSEGKPSALDKLVEGLASNPSAIPQIIQSFKSTASGVGLNAAQGARLSAVKSKAVDTISNDHVQDDHVAASYYVLVEAVKENHDFLRDYYELLTNYKIINGSDNTNHSEV